MVGKDKAIKFFLMINIENLQKKPSIHSVFKNQAKGIQTTITVFVIIVISFFKK